MDQSVVGCDPDMLLGLLLSAIKEEHPDLD